MKQTSFDLSLTVGETVSSKEDTVFFGFVAGAYKDDRRLLTFFEDLVSGTPFPLHLSVSKLDLSSIVASFVFFRRDAVIHPSCASLVYAAYLFDSKALPSHVDQDLCYFFRFLVSHLSKTTSKTEQGERLAQAIAWLGEYVLEGNLPNLKFESASATVLEVGTNGFVLASTPSLNTDLAWEHLFRSGHLRGVLVSLADRKVSIAKKSVSIGFDLVRCRDLLNNLEAIEGGVVGWCLRDNLFLDAPKEGTSILMSDIVSLCLRI